MAGQNANLGNVGSVALGTIDVGGNLSGNIGGNLNGNIGGDVSVGSLTANSLFLSAGGNIGSDSAPVQLDVQIVDQISGGGNVTIVQNRPEPNPVGLLRAERGALHVDVPNGGLIDNNGGGPNIVSDQNAEFNAQFLGTADDALEVDVGGDFLLEVRNDRLDRPVHFPSFFCPASERIGEFERAIPSSPS